MKRRCRWWWLVLLALAFGCLGGGCQPETINDDSDLPWSAPEDWEGGAPLGVGF